MTIVTVIMLRIVTVIRITYRDRIHDCNSDNDDGDNIDGDISDNDNYDNSNIDPDGK